MAYPKRTPSNNYLPFYLFTVFSLDLHHDKIFQWFPFSTEPSPDCKVYLCTVLNPPCAALYLAALPVRCCRHALALATSCPDSLWHMWSLCHLPEARGRRGLQAAKDPAAAGAKGWRGAAPPGNLPVLPRWCFQPGCCCLAELGCRPSAGGCDCRAAECNQSREETNNLLSPLQRCWRSSAALLQGLRRSPCGAGGLWGRMNP